MNIQINTGTRFRVRRATRQAGWRLAIKRVFDIVAAVTLLAIAVPILAVSAAAILIETGRPVFYRAPRLGRHQERFRIWKLRSMAANADDRAHRDFVVRAMTHPDAPEVANGAKKLEDDIRVTRVGRFLRKTSVDELPQLFNVLAGQMSLVGPRPEVPYAVDHYEPRYLRRFDVLPGITGLWQVSGRSELSVLEMLDLDVQYADRWSMWRDLWILLRTIPSVLTSRGAGI